MDTQSGQLPVKSATVTATVPLLLVVDHVVFVQGRVLGEPFATVLKRNEETD